MNITLTPYQHQALESAIQHSMDYWNRSIAEALEGNRPAFSTIGAQLIIQDLEEVREQLKSNL
jgi:hypothetical protein